MGRTIGRLSSYPLQHDFLGDDRANEDTENGKRKQQYRDLEWRRCHVKRSVSTGRVHLDCNASARLGLERC